MRARTERQVAPVGTCDGAAYGQAHTGAATRRRFRVTRRQTCVRNPLERVEDAGAPLGRYPGPAIADGELYSVARASRLDLDGVGAPAIEGVVHQVLEQRTSRDGRSEPAQR
jgi:hypothetical protein